ncbi:MAG: winged helix-turn-helix domain-containing protein [Candidatus Methanoperedens sp.]|nr:winged helix-turn-helix domain-containing protein [Candidatus Methanoperedens sp.]
MLKLLIDRPYNANQLAEAMNMDYKTIRHHLDILTKNGVITMEGDKYMTFGYFDCPTNICDTLMP